MHLRTLRKTIGEHFRIGSFCYAFVYQDTFAYGILLCICVPFEKKRGTLSHRQFLLCVCVPGHFCIRNFTMHLRTLPRTIGGHFCIVNFGYAFVYPDTFAYGILLCICVPFLEQ